MAVKTNKLIILFLTIPLFLIILSGCKKEALFIDENLSYELANNNNNGFFYCVFDDGKEYNGDEVFLNSVLAGRNKRFDYKNVWKNQSNDVHPPLYYALLHSVCSIMPDTFSKWQGIGINLIFAAVTLLFLYKMTNKIILSEVGSILIVLGYGITESFIDAGIFIRMYMMLNAVVAITSYLYYKLLYEKNENIKFYLVLTVVVTAGVLTQYFFLIYLFFLTVISIWILLTKKRYMAIIRLGFSLAISAIASYMVFPAMIYHIFKGYRGKESFNNLVSNSSFTRNIKMYMHYVLKGITGYPVILTAITIVVLLMILVFGKKGGDFCKSGWIRSLPFLLSSFCFIIVVAKISPQFAERYIWCVAPLVFSCMMTLFYSLLIFNGNRKTKMVILAATVLICGGSTLFSGLMYDFDECHQSIENVSKHSDNPCIYIYLPEIYYMTVDNYPELKDYDNLVYYASDNLNYNSMTKNYNKQQVVLISTPVENRDEIINKIRDEGGYKKVELLTVDGHDLGVESYLLSKNEE